MKLTLSILFFGGKLAETLASYATKGSLISVDGELRTRRFEKNGQMNYVTEVLVTGFQLLESRAQRAMAWKIMQDKIWRIWFWKRKNCQFLSIKKSELVSGFFIMYKCVTMN